jgi:general secretion pathway protein A
MTSSYLSHFGLTVAPSPVFLLDESHLLHQDVPGACTYSSTTSGTPRPCSTRCWWACRSWRAVWRAGTTAASIPGCRPACASRRSLPMTPPSTCACAWLMSDASASCLPSMRSGALRDMDRLATAVLREASRKKKKLVERDTLARVLDTGSQED